MCPLSPCQPPRKPNIVTSRKFQKQHTTTKVNTVYLEKGFILASRTTSFRLKWTSLGCPSVMENYRDSCFFFSGGFEVRSTLSPQYVNFEYEWRSLIFSLIVHYTPLSMYNCVISFADSTDADVQDYLAFHLHTESARFSCAWTCYRFNRWVIYQPTLRLSPGRELQWDFPLLFQASECGGKGFLIFHLCYLLKLIWNLLADLVMIYLIDRDGQNICWRCLIDLKHF